MRWLIMFFLLTGAAMAEPIPTGSNVYYDSTTGNYTLSLGPGGVPRLNYHDGQRWVKIVDDWVQVGDRQIWKSVIGGHRAWADSTGAAIYAKGNHYLGTETTKLIKFSKADSTWEVLYSSDPDSITVARNYIVFHGIFPGVDKWLTNNPKVFENYTEQYIFSQGARDSLADHGPWTNHFVGTVTKLGTDSLNVTWEDIEGTFDIDVAGRTTSGYVEALDGESRIFAIAASRLSTGDSTTSIPVHKRFVLFEGNKYFIEMFNPVLAAQLPDGPIYHNATFGSESEAGGSLAIADMVKGGVFPAVGDNGTVTSIDAYIKVSGGSNPNRWMSVAIAEWDSVAGGAIYTTILDTDKRRINKEITPVYAWENFPLDLTPSITAGKQYSLWMWGQEIALETQIEAVFCTSDCGTTDSLVFYNDVTAAYDWSDNSPQATADWPDPLLTGFHVAQPPRIFATYDVAAEAAGQVIIIGESSNEKDDLIPLCLRDIEWERVGDRLSDPRDFYIFDSGRADMR